MAGNRSRGFVDAVTYQFAVFSLHRALVLSLLTEDHGKTIYELAKDTRLPNRRLRRMLGELHRTGQVRRV